MTDTQVPEVTGNPDDPREVIAQAANRFIAAVGAEAVPSDVAARIALAAGLFSGDLLKLLPDPAAEQARNFLLDDDSWIEAECPACCEKVLVTGGHVFPRGSGTGIPIDGLSTLGALVDAANSHVCGDGEAGDGD